MSSAQLYIWDIGGGVGASNYLGDIGGYDGPQNDNSLKDLHIKSTNFSINAFARVRPVYRMSLKFDLTWARIKGADSLTKEWPERYVRNLSFRTDIIELSAQAHYFFLIINDLAGKKRFNKALYSYIGGGVGLMYYNPQAYYDGQWYNLQPLNTEGKENQYARIAPTLPLSFGMIFEWRDERDRYGHKVDRYRRHRVGLELCYRFTSTDYLDDISTDYPNLDAMDETSRNLSSRSSEVADDPRSGDIPIENYTTEGSPRGDPSDKDHFMTITLSYSYIIKTHKRKFRRPKYNYVYGNVKRRGKRARY